MATLPSERHPNPNSREGIPNQRPSSSDHRENSAPPGRPAFPRRAQISRVDRDDFLELLWNYEPGEHVTIIGPTGSGKTTLAYQLLDETTTRELPGVILVMKPRDSVVRKWSKDLRYKVVRTWPPIMPNRIFSKSSRKRGWVVWPKHTFDPKTDDENLKREFRIAILDCYQRGNRVLFCDEVGGLEQDLGLTTELRTVWQRGRSMGCGLWAATQRPTHISLHAYSQAEHLFLFKTPDRRDRDRFKEIGGTVDPDLVGDAVMSLNEYEFLYIKRNPLGLAIVSP